MADFDLFVIGAGSGGVRAARVSAAYGAKVAIAEEHKVGGTCVIRGCVPKKLLIYGSHFAEDLDDAAVISILMNSVKQRKDSIDQFRKGGREDLATKEEAELKILQAYLPAQMSADELASMVESVIKETGATGMKDMGGVIKAVMAKAAGKVEGAAVSDMVKRKLSS